MQLILDDCNLIIGQIHSFCKQLTDKSILTSEGNSG